MATKVRARERALDLNDTKKDAGLAQLIIEVYKAKLEQNRTKNAYEKKRKELLGKMTAAKLPSKILEAIEIEPGKDRVTLKAEVATPQHEKADIRKLVKLVDSETFMNIVSATKDAILTFAGEAVFQQCKRIENGTENVSVDLVKE